MRANHKDSSRDICHEICEREDEEPTHKPEKSFSVLNELVVDRGPNATLSSTELFGDDEHLTSVQADGICIATPTGSTAYSLAAGGSLSHPDNPVMLVSPICAHSLSFRPIILPDSMVIRVAVPYDARTTAWASFDGKERVELHQGDYVTIAASRFPFAFIQSKPHQGDWFDSLSRTLQWNSRTARQKAFDTDNPQPKN
ncbi:hypothetical protein TWF191_006910 [Orbilia oligospora]|nr:hypothetical protein TWF191_006910 [Orbilia oligospora]